MQQSGKFCLVPSFARPLTSFPCVGCASYRTYNTCSFQAYQDRFSCFSLCCNCAACIQCMQVCFNSHNGTSRFTEIFFAFTNSRRKPDTVKVNASLGFARIIVPVRNIMLWAKSTCTIYSQGIITGSFAKKKNLFRGIAIISHCSTKVKHFLCRKSAL